MKFQVFYKQMFAHTQSAVFGIRTLFWAAFVCCVTFFYTKKMLNETTY